MFRTTKCSSSGRLYKQLYGILSCICIGVKDNTINYIINEKSGKKTRKKT